MRARSHVQRGRRLILAAAVAAPLATAALEQPSGHAGRSRDVATLHSGTLSFLGHTTVGDFIGSTSDVTGGATGDVRDPRGWVEARVSTLATGNARRDRDMRASLEADRHPTLRLDVTGATPADTIASPGDTFALLVHGRLAIHGITRAVDVPVTVVRAGDTLLVRGRFPLDLADYDIGGLTRMLGILRMQRRIEVSLDLKFVSISTARERVAVPYDAPRSTHLLGSLHGPMIGGPSRDVLDNRNPHARHGAGARRGADRERDARDTRGGAGALRSRHARDRRRR